jgi:hypothetical protein
VVAHDEDDLLVAREMSQKAECAEAVAFPNVPGTDEDIKNPGVEAGRRRDRELFRDGDLTSPKASANIHLDSVQQGRFRPSETVPDVYMKNTKESRIIRS